MHCTMNKYGFCLALAFSALVSGCSVHAGTSDDVQAGSQSLTYDLTENNCDTKSHDFSSHDDYCNGLESMSLNNGCAEDMRVSLYHSDCGPNFQDAN
jgi:hypothetical protein